MWLKKSMLYIVPTFIVSAMYYYTNLVVNVHKVHELVNFTLATRVLLYMLVIVFLAYGNCFFINEKNKTIDDIVSEYLKKAALFSLLFLPCLIAFSTRNLIQEIAFPFSILLLLLFSLEYQLRNSPAYRILLGTTILLLLGGIIVVVHLGIFDSVPKYSLSAIWWCNSTLLLVSVFLIIPVKRLRQRGLAKINDIVWLPIKSSMLPNPVLPTGASHLTRIQFSILKVKIGGINASRRIRNIRLEIMLPIVNIAIALSKQIKRIVRQIWRQLYILFPILATYIFAVGISLCIERVINPLVAFLQGDNWNFLGVGLLCLMIFLLIVVIKTLIAFCYTKSLGSNYVEGKPFANAFWDSFHTSIEPIIYLHVAFLVLGVVFCVRYYVSHNILGFKYPLYTGLTGLAMFIGIVFLRIPKDMLPKKSSKEYFIFHFSPLDWRYTLSKSWQLLFLCFFAIGAIASNTITRSIEQVASNFKNEKLTVTASNISKDTFQYNTPRQLKVKENTLFDSSSFKASYIKSPSKEDVVILPVTSASGNDLSESKTNKVPSRQYAKRVIITKKSNHDLSIITNGKGYVDDSLLNVIEKREENEEDIWRDIPSARVSTFEGESTKQGVWTQDEYRIAHRVSSNGEGHRTPHSYDGNGHGTPSYANSYTDANAHGIRHHISPYENGKGRLVFWTSCTNCDWAIAFDGERASSLINYLGNPSSLTCDAARVLKFDKPGGYIDYHVFFHDELVKTERVLVPVNDCIFIRLNASDYEGYRHRRR